MIAIISGSNFQKIMDGADPQGLTCAICYHPVSRHDAIGCEVCEQNCVKVADERLKREAGR